MLSESPGTGLSESAEDYAKRGLPIIPLVGKRPAIKSWQLFVATPVNVRFWFGNRRSNIGLRTGESGYVVIDLDSKAAEEWVKHIGILQKATMLARSGGGGLHIYARSPEGVEIRNKQGLHKIVGLDIRGHGGFIVLPPSMHETGNRYEWLTDILPPSVLPVFDPEWVVEKRSEPQLERKPRFPVVRSTVASQIRDIRAYIRAVPSVQGNNGNKGLMRVCYLLVEHGFDFGSALVELENWNRDIPEPAWTSQELERALTSAFRLKLQTALNG